MANTVSLAKPANSNWTDDQWKAIVTSGSNVLVSAAAGSGKTAVLVERIIRKISDNTDVDRLLVATFTKAAAAEMKERIRLALEKELVKNAHSEHLRRQLALMNRASITTLHSFCLDVIRRFYPLIGLDPGFRIANETESELLRLDVLDALFEQRYEGVNDDNGAFLMLADSYGGERGDEPLYRLVQSLYDFAQSHPWPEFWLEQTASAFEMDSMDELRASAWVQHLKKDIELALEGGAGMLEQALELTRQPAGPAPYAAAFDEDLAMIRELASVVQHKPWDEWAEHFQALSFGKLKAMRGDEYDKSLQEAAKELRDSVKKLVTDLADELFGRSAEQFLEELKQLAPLMKALAQLVIDFGRRYEEAKRSKGLLDFGDLEHYCLRILRDPSSTPEQLIPSAAAREYQEQFDEILLDEYQDTNMVQEAIVSCIERTDRGNRFMVGDVKQSIYRFRLAEPGLFLEKYKTYAAESCNDEHIEQKSGLRIDLARNFRSRREVVDGVNDVFHSIMRENIAEMDYDERAELVCGASYPEAEPKNSCDVEWIVLNKAEEVVEDEDGSADVLSLTDDEQGGAVFDSAEGQETASPSELKTAQLEARLIAEQLKGLMDSGFSVYDAKKGLSRPLLWRDVVILLRATQQWAPIIIEELQSFGIPAYAELSSGYFDAVEVETMLSLLRIIDNPYQDIPLAASLRSPLFGLNAEQLAAIRIGSKQSNYYDAVLHAAGDLTQDEELRSRLSLFLECLDRWRAEARQGSLAELLWSIYRETGYYDFVGGLPGGVQRQANLRALHDRARQYEATSFRGLFRFLRFIERMRDSGGDLGTARALGEQENVVRIMSIHKSKGLEFPVVFVAGLGKAFNQQDIRSSFLKHKQMGFGPRFVDAELRISYPTLPFLAIRRAMRMEMLAEEMRILYVALTRPKEKMFLIGTVADMDKKRKRWLSVMDKEGKIPDYHVASARSFIDWLGPLAAEQLQEEEGTSEDGTGVRWRARIAPAAVYISEAAAASESDDYDSQTAVAERLQAIASLALLEHVEPDEELRERLEWQYPYQQAAVMTAKTSVTEMKRLHSVQMEDAYSIEGLELTRHEGQSVVNQTHTQSFRLRRPSFMEQYAMTASEKGSVNHLLMQHMPLGMEMDAELLMKTLDDMLARKLLKAEHLEAIDHQAVIAFFESELGKRLTAAQWVKREVPFSCMLPAHKVYPDSGGAIADEPIMIQGVIDCLFEDERGLVLVDYKTDRIWQQNWKQQAERHRFQLELYAEAIGSVLGRKVSECYVFFFDGGQTVKL